MFNLQQGCPSSRQQKQERDPPSNISIPCQGKITFSMNNVFERNPFIKSNTLAMAPSTPFVYLVHLAFMSLAFGAGLRACSEPLIQLAVSISILMVLVVSISTMMLLQTASALAASISIPALLCLAFTSLAFFAGLCEESLPVMLAVPIEMTRSIAKTLLLVRSLTMKLQAAAAGSILFLLPLIDTARMFLAVQFLSTAGLCVGLRSVLLASANRIFRVLCSSMMLTIQATAAADINLVCFFLAIVAGGAPQLHVGEFVPVVSKLVSNTSSSFLVIQVSILMLGNPVIHGIECSPAPEDDSCWLDADALESEPTILDTIDVPLTSH
jgi:hypothetical protein